MKNLILLVLVASSFSAYSQLNNPSRQGQEKKVQVAILFDTSNSMDGLINQARSRIWNIINTLGKLQYEGVRPTMEIALYEYGNSNLKAEDKYIRQLNGFSSDLDKISSSLFSLATNGGNEFCGSVILSSVDELKWSQYKEDIRLIYIAGNEPFNQGTDNYIDVLQKAKENDIYVNTIYCGPYEKGVEELWLSGAEFGRGKYFNIDSDKKIKHISTPYDDTIRKLNLKLNETYIGYGRVAKKKKEMQLAEDENAELMAPSSAVERAVSKSSSYYSNSSWDLVDQVGNDKKKLERIEEDQLPEEMRGNSVEENLKYLEAKAKDRKVIQTEIQRLAKMRGEFIKNQIKDSKNEDSDDFGKAVQTSIKEIALSKNYSLNN